MDDLVTWLRAQLDDDERVAREADSGRWLPEDKGITFEYRADDFHDGEAQARLVADTRANQWHIANWDPTRVLAEIDAKRRVLDMCTTYVAPEEEGMANSVIMALAQPYADRPGWREEWQLSAPA